MIEVSVIVPFHNSRDHIEQCLLGLAGQDYPASRYEVIVVDNNSTDGSPELVKKYSQV